jgi:hypothetical protein
MADLTGTKDKVSKDKLNRLTKYAEHIKTRISSAIPEKHKHRVDTYKKWLDSEFRRTMRKIESLQG